MLRAAVLLFAALTTFAQVPSDSEIRKILADRVGAENLGKGMVVGVIDPSGRRVVGYGSLSKNDQRHPDANTFFETASITKVFTSLLLTDMARRGEVALTDPVSKYLPANVKVPERNGRKITLADLSTHRSGLPRDINRPFQSLYGFLSGYQLTRDPGSQYEYSNLGNGVLGQALALRAGMSYEELVRSRICDPLGMTDTRVTLTPEMKLRYAGDPITPSFMPDLPGAAGLRSTVNDMLVFLAANLGYVKTPLAQAMADQVSIRLPTAEPGAFNLLGTEVAYGWFFQSKDGESIIWKDGLAPPYNSYIAYDPKARAGVVVFANFATTAGLVYIGRHLLKASFPLTQSPGTQAALRRSIQELQIGRPRFDLMSARFAQVMRSSRRADLEPQVAQLGALQAVSFDGVGPGGGDIYQVRFKHATTDWRILLGPDGKTENVDIAGIRDADWDPAFLGDFSAFVFALVVVWRGSNWRIRLSAILLALLALCQGVLVFGAPEIIIETGIGRIKEWLELLVIAICLAALHLRSKKNREKRASFLQAPTI